MNRQLFAFTVVLTLSVSALATEKVTMVTPTGEGQQYWPGWRGPSAQGYVSGSGYADKWSATENVRWKVAVAGTGNSSPIIWDDRIFLTTSYDGGNRLSLLCYQRSDGTLVWERSIPQTGLEHVHDKNGYASATPVTDGQRIYASFGTHGVVAIDFDGNIVWRRQLSELDNYHGSAGSPLLYKDTVILYQDHQGQSFVAALDKETGDIKWRKDRTAKTGWGTPIVVRTEDRDELIVSSQHQVNAYDPSNGELLWFAKGNKFEVVPTPTVGRMLPGKVPRDRRSCRRPSSLETPSTWSTTW